MWLPEKEDHNVTGARDIADRLMASFGSMLLYWYHFSHNGKRIETETEDDSIAAHFLHLLHGKKPRATVRARAGHVAGAVCRARIQCLDLHRARDRRHRVRTCTRRMTGAIGALRGPKHGGAQRGGDGDHRALPQPPDAEADIRARVERKEIIIGFGHPVYTVSDPRNEIIKEVSRKLCTEGGNPTLFEVSERIEK